ncbi:MAG: hypothetical protein ACYTBJ_03050 [Planctomycetota bacterium]
MIQVILTGKCYQSQQSGKSDSWIVYLATVGASIGSCLPEDHKIFCTFTHFNKTARILEHRWVFIKDAQNQSPVPQFTHIHNFRAIKFCTSISGVSSPCWLVFCRKNVFRQFPAAMACRSGLLASNGVSIGLGQKFQVVCSIPSFLKIFQVLAKNSVDIRRVFVYTTLTYSSCRPGMERWGISS